jgi:hypothetical protein
MVSQERFELPTHALEGRCSIQLSYWDILVSMTFLIIISHHLKVNTLFSKIDLIQGGNNIPPHKNQFLTGNTWANSFISPLSKSYTFN